MIEISLPCGATALIDAHHRSLAAGYRWRSDANGYVACKVGKVLIYLHRLLLGALPGSVVDHRNGDRLDNRESNLRICTHAENMRNRKVSKSNKLGIKGVWFDASRGRYRSELRAAGSRFSLGSFSTAAEAHAAYVTAAKLHHGEFARFE